MLLDIINLIEFSGSNNKNSSIDTNLKEKLQNYRSQLSNVSDGKDVSS